MKKNTNVVSLVVLGAGIIAAVATGMQSRNANAIPKDAIVASGSAQGMEGPVKVEVAFSQDKIYSVTVTEANETPDIGTKAIDALPGTIVAENSLNVDAVSGATITSTAIKNAAAQAMSDAGVDPSAFGYAGEAGAETEAAETESEAAAAETEAGGDAGSVQKAHDAAAGKTEGADGYLNRYSADATAASTADEAVSTEGGSVQKAHDAAAGKTEGADGYLNRYSADATAASTADEAVSTEGGSVQKAHDAAAGKVSGAAGYLNRYSA